MAETGFDGFLRGIKDVVRSVAKSLDPTPKTIPPEEINQKSVATTICTNMVNVQMRGRPDDPVDSRSQSTWFSLTDLLINMGQWKPPATDELEAKRYSDIRAETQAILYKLSGSGLLTKKTLQEVLKARGKLNSDPYGPNTRVRNRDEESIYYAVTGYGKLFQMAGRPPRRW